MIVYVVLGETPYDPPRFCDVFSTIELAEKYIEGYPGSYHSYIIKKIEVK